MSSVKLEEQDASTTEKQEQHSQTLPIHQVKRNRCQIRPEGESGRHGVHPIKFLVICFRSSCHLSQYVNILWPVVPAAPVLHWARPDQDLWDFILPYIAMVPSANLLGFAGQELARKLPKVAGVLLETAIGSAVEIILFMVLIVEGDRAVPIIKAAILGSILANFLLCLGLCFFAGGILREEQVFHEAVSEVGGNLMLVAAFGLIVPGMFNAALSSAEDVTDTVLRISRATALILLVAFCVYIYFQIYSHHGLYDTVLNRDEDITEDHSYLYKPKLTLTEALIALAFALAMVSIMAVFLVKRIEFIVSEHNVKDAFLGLILVPLVEKAAEHITAVDEAWDNQMNLALAHVLGSSIQTALLNTPLVVIVGWGKGVAMDLNFEIFDAAVLILAVLVVGNFLRDNKSNYLEGVLCVLVYVIIAISAFYYPDPKTNAGTATSGGSGTG